MFPDGLSTLLKMPGAVDLPGLLSRAGEAVAFVDGQWIVRYCNDVYLANVGKTSHEVLGHTPFEYIPSFERSIFYETVENCRRENKPMCRIGYSTALGRWLMVRVFPVDGGVLLLANDASESVVEQQQLAQQALADPLTGLPNKLSLKHDLATGGATALAILGIARCDEITQVLGYADGDKALLALASLLQSATRDGERLYKLPGHEFALLLPHEDTKVRLRLLALTEPLRGPMELGGQRFFVEPRVGCVKLEPGTQDVEAGLRRAALALRQASDEPAGGVVFYEPRLELASVHRKQLESELRDAIAAGQLTLFLQPKVAVADGTLAGAEALIRWRHPERGMVPPADFLPLAQSSGLMPQIDAFVLRTAIGMLDDLRRRGLEVPVSINLSVDALADDRLEGDVAWLLSCTGLPPRLLEIELPEGALIRNVETSLRVLGRLHAMGVRLSVDDFGTGYSSFSYLARFPVHTLKIDRSFITGLLSNPTHHKIVKGIVRVAHSLQLQVVAEGAETAEEMQALRRLHCDMAQGYAYARPMPLEDFVAFAHAQQATPRMLAQTV